MATNTARREGHQSKEILIRGTVLRAPLSFDGGSYRVLVIDDGQEERALIGNMPNFCKGQLIEAWVIPNVHKRFGLRYRARFVRETGFKDEAAIISYLSSPVFKNIGKSRATAIVETFGMDTVQILDENPDRFDEVPGIGPILKKRIKREWKAERTPGLVISSLTQMGLTYKTAALVWRSYGPGAVNIVKNDTYDLMFTCGMGFGECDAIALAIGMPADSPERISTAAVHILDLALRREGHCYLPTDDLASEVGELLSLRVTSSDVITAVTDMRRGSVNINSDYSALQRVNRAEQAVAEKLRALAVPQLMHRSREGMLAHAKRLGLLGNLKLADEQVNAVYNPDNHNISVITGQPGTGKTTILRTVCRLLAGNGLNVTLCATTGLAAKRLSEATGLAAATIHRTIGIMEGGAIYNDENRLNTDVVMVDEASMLDVLVADSLLSALPDRCRLVLIGDDDQLPSVGPGRVLHDIIESGTVPVTRLTEVFRQDSDSSILSVAQAIRKGEAPELPDFSGFVDGGCAIVTANEPKDVTSAVLKLITKTLPDAGFSFDTAKVLSPMKKQELGTRAFNELLQLSLNREVDSKGPFLDCNKARYYKGDAVMQVVNNYEKGCFNGDVGKVVRVDMERNELYVQYPEKEEPVKYSRNYLQELILAYACTVHKSQGSEYPVVILVMHPSQQWMLRRKILYTGLTRSSRMCIIVGTRAAVKTAVFSDKDSRRYTMLGRYLTNLRSEALVKEAA